MLMFLFAVVEARIYFFGDGAVFFPNVRNIKWRTAAGEVGLGIETYKTLGLFLIALADGEHL